MGLVIKFRIDLHRWQAHRAYNGFVMNIERVDFIVAPRSRFNQPVKRENTSKETASSNAQ